MAKDPAVMFYTSDFLTGTLLMNYAQKGKYITLLCLQHQQGHLSEDDMLSVCGSYDEKVFSKFLKDENGNYYNERMETEAIKRKKFVESRQNNLSKNNSKDVHLETHTNSHMERHMGNHTEVRMENENINVSVIKDESNNYNKKFIFTPPTLDEVIQYAKTKDREDLAKPFYDYFTEGKWVDSKGQKVRSWKQKFLTWCNKTEKQKGQPTSIPKYSNFNEAEAIKRALERTYGNELTK